MMCLCALNVCTHTGPVVVGGVRSGGSVPGVIQGGLMPGELALKCLVSRYVW